MMPLDRIIQTFGQPEPRSVEVRMPRQHEGIHRALKSSFDGVQPMPDEMDRLLARLR